VHFYDVGGLLVRRWMPARRRKSLEVWKGEGWAPYPEVDTLLRHGHRLTEDQAVTLLHRTRESTETPRRFSDGEARVALHARTKRA
jgi:hypothetical protein